MNNDVNSNPSQTRPEDEASDDGNELLESRPEWILRVTHEAELTSLNQPIQKSRQLTGTL